MREHEKKVCESRAESELIYLHLNAVALQWTKHKEKGKNYIQIN